MSGSCEYIPQPRDRIQSSLNQPSDRKIEIIRLILLSIVAVSIAWLNLLPSPRLSNIIILVAVCLAGYPIFKESFSALRKGRINMELSMVIAIIASLLLLQFLPAIVITLFALLSEFVEEYIVLRGRRSIELLYTKAPKKAILLKESIDNKKNGSITALEQTEEVLVERVKIGDIVLVREGDNIPIDGYITKGLSTIDQSSITGESMPVEKTVGEFVYAGTTNITNKLEIKCQNISSDTAYAKIIRLVEESESSKAPIQKLSDKMATRLIQFAIGLSLLTYVITQDIVSTLSVIVVAGACGLAVGTPIALLASNSKLARKGTIVKGGLQIENLSNAKTIVFDKTGTLTVGKPYVTQILSFNTLFDGKKILEYAAIAERNVNHPLAKAIVEKAYSENIIFDDSNTTKSEVDSANPSNRMDNNNEIRIGRGISIFHNSQWISVGNAKFMEGQNLKLNGKDSSQLNVHFDKIINLPGRYSTKSNLDSFGYHSEQQQFESNFKTSDTTTDALNKTKPGTTTLAATTVFVAVNREIVGVILLEDKLRKETRETILELTSMGLDTIMLTGDNEHIAKKISEEAGIKDYYANLLPDDKVLKIKEIINSNCHSTRKNNKKSSVLMVGDGINDAPALAESDVGIAMGMSGTDIAIETADVILMTDNLSKIPHLIKSSRRTIFTIKQNFVGTLLIDGLGFVLAFVGLLNPLLAAFIHISSELLFMVNSARLLK